MQKWTAITEDTDVIQTRTGCLVRTHVGDHAALTFVSGAKIDDFKETQCEPSNQSSEELSADGC